MEVLKPTPNSQVNEQYVHTLASLSDSELREKGHECAELLTGGELMPHARESTERLLDHICFEITYRINQGVGEIDGDLQALQEG